MDYTLLDKILSYSESFDGCLGMSTYDALSS
jgi:hypothetical protein